MYELKNTGKVFTGKFDGTGPSSYKKEFTGPRSHKCWENTDVEYLIFNFNVLM
jgi:hypothetical protein